MHIVFSTKHREPFIKDSKKEELFSYLGGVCLDLESQPIIVGGTCDHVHLLINLSRKIALMTLVERVKTSSSKWIKDEGIEYYNFYWQNGYGGFSVSRKHIEEVRRYIQNQEEHHRNISFKDEYRKHLRTNGVGFDERYIWD
jgi:REP element-mobilizing transposase RayT